MARITIDPAVVAALGIPADRIANMGLRELGELAYERGFTWSVSSRPSEDPGVTVCMTPQLASAGTEKET